MAGSIAASSQAWSWSSNRELYWDTIRRQGGGRLRDWPKERHPGNSLGFWNLKPHPQRHTSSNKVTPSNPSQKNSTNWEPSIQIYKSMGAVLIQTTLTVKNNNVVKSQVWPNCSLNRIIQTPCVIFLYLSLVKKYLSVGSKYNLECLWYRLPCMCM